METQHDNVLGVIYVAGPTLYYVIVCDLFGLIMALTDCGCLPSSLKNAREMFNFVNIQPKLPPFLNLSALI